MSSFVNPTEDTYQQKEILLSQEFDRFLNREQIYRSKNTTEIEYKNIYCAINIRNKQKRKNLGQIAEDLKRLQTQNISSLNFKHLNKFTMLNDISSRSMYNSQRVNHTTSSSLIMRAPKFSKVEQAIYSEKMVNESLLLQMQELKISLNKIKSQLKLLNETNDEISKKMGKFKTVLNVSNCQKIYSAFCINRAQKNYWQLIQTQTKQQEKFQEISKKLKKSQQNLKQKYLKRECKKNSLEKKYLQKINEMKKLQKLQSLQKKQNLCYTVTLIESLIKLIEVNQKQFEQILLQSCVKPRHTLKESDMMSDIRINQIKMINDFEKKYNIKIETADRIIINIFKKLKQNQKATLIQFDQFVKLQNEFQMQYRNLLIKQSNLQTNSTTVNEFEDINWIKQFENKIKYDSQIESLIQAVCSQGSFNLNLIQFLKGNLSRFGNLFNLLKENLDDKKFEQLLENLKRVLNIDMNSENKSNWNNLLKYEKFTFSTQINQKIIHEYFTQFFRAYNQYQGIKQIQQILISDKKSSLLLIYSHVAQIIKAMGVMDELLLRVIQSLFQYCQQQFNNEIKLMFDCFIKCIKFIKIKSLQLQIVPIIEINDAKVIKQPKKFYSQFLSNDSQQIQEKNEENHNVIKEQLPKNQKNQLEVGFDETIINKLLKTSKTELLSINNNYKFK